MVAVPGVRSESALMLATSVSMPAVPMVTCAPLSRTRSCCDNSMLPALAGCRRGSQAVAAPAVPPVRTEIPPLKALGAVATVPTGVVSSDTEPPLLATTCSSAPLATSMRLPAAWLTTSRVNAIWRLAGVSLPTRPGTTSSAGATSTAPELASSTSVPPLMAVSDVSSISPASMRPPPPTLTAPSFRSRKAVPFLPADRLTAPLVLSDRLLPHRLPSFTAVICWASSRTAAPLLATAAPLKAIAPVVLNSDASSTRPSASRDLTVSLPPSPRVAPAATVTSLVSDRFSLPAVNRRPLTTRVAPVLALPVLASVSCPLAPPTCSTAPLPVMAWSTRTASERWKRSTPSTR